jgi:hypothetical protein
MSPQTPPIGEPPGHAVSDALRRDLAPELVDLLLWAGSHAGHQAEALGLCVWFAVHADPQVRGHAIRGLGHIARRFRHLPVEPSRFLLDRALHDRDAFVRDQAAAAILDIQQFAGGS